MSLDYLTPQQILQHAIQYEAGIIDFRMLYKLLHILVNNVDGMETLRVKICSTTYNRTPLNENDCDFLENVPAAVPTNNSVGKEEQKKTGFHEITINDVVKQLNSGTVKAIRSHGSMETVPDTASEVLNEAVKGNAEKEEERKDRNSFACEERVTKLENFIGNLTVAINDLSRNFNVLESTFTQNDDVGRLTYRLKELESLYGELFKRQGGNSSKSVPEEKVEIEKTEVDVKTSESPKVAKEAVVIQTTQLTENQDCIKLDALLKDVTQLKNEFKEIKTATSFSTNPPVPVNESRLKAIEDKLSHFESIFASLDTENKKPPKQQPSLAHNLDAVQANIDTIKDELEKLGDLSGFLLSEKETFAKALQKISAQIQTIKDEKADKEDVREALTSKADYNSLQNKVSNEELTATKCDMSKHITELIESLTEKEHAWKQTIKDIQRLLGSKIDHHDIMPLKTYIKTQIDSLQGQLKALENMKEENEAAGTRSKFLTNVNCVSCDAKAIMRRADDKCQGMMKNDGLRPILSLKPYLCYKLDEVRKESREMSARSTFSYRMCDQKPLGGAIYDPNYLCNRYCGGHHTKFNIYDRVSRCAFLRPCCNKRRF